MTLKYEINENNALMHEIIGLNVKVIENKNKNLKNIKGRIVDETKNLLCIETNKGIKKILKKDAILRLYLENNKKIEFNGKDINFSPVERTKIAWRKIYARMQ